MIRKNRRHFLILICIMLITAVSLSSCGIDEIISGDEDEKEYTVSNDIYLAMSKVHSLNPVISKDEDTYMISKVIFDSLFELDEKMTPHAVLVDSYSFDNSENSLTLDLVQGITFHDGSEFNANDVKYSINAYREAGTRSVYSNYVENIKDVSVIGPYKVEIEYESSDDISLSYLTFPILSSTDYKEIDSLLYTEDDFEPMGTGPYRFESYDDNKYLKLVPNEGYAGKKAKNNLLFKVLPKKDYQFRLIESGNVNVIFSDEQDRYAKVSDPDIAHVDYPGRSVEFIAFNCRKDATADARVRQAIAYAVDTGTIRKECYYNTCTFCDSLYYPGFMGCKIDKDFYKTDDSKADDLLSEAGCKDTDDDGILDLDGKNMRFDILVWDGDECRRDAAEIIKDTLSNYRIKASVISLDRHDLNSRLSKGDFDLYIGGYEFDESFDLKPLAGINSDNCTGYEDIDLNDKLEKLKSGVDTDEAKALVSAIKEKLSEELPYYPMLYKTCGAIQSEQLSGKVKFQFNNYLADCKNWRCKFEKTVDN